METMKQKIRKSKLLIPTLLLVGLLGGIVAAQLMSNRIQQEINIKGIDGQIELTVVTGLPSSEWFGESMSLKIQVEKIRGPSGYIYLEINNTDLTGVSPGDITLMLSHRKADGSAQDNSLEYPMTVMDSNAVQFTEMLEFFELEDICQYSFQITWESSCVSGNYTVSVFVENS